MELNIKHKAIGFLEKNRRENLQDLELSKKPQTIRKLTK